MYTVISSCKTKQKSTSQATSETKKIKGLTGEAQNKFAFYFVEGCKEKMKGNFETAESLFKECSKINPASIPVKYELANIYRVNGQVDLALQNAKECAISDPKNEWYQLLYLDILHNKRLFSQSAEVYNKLIKNFPYRPEFYEGLAAEYMYSGLYEKSFKTYDELEKKFGQNESFTLNKIKLLKQLKKNKEAEEELKKLIRYNPNELRYYTYLAEFYQQNNQIDKAYQTYQEALKIDPKNAMVHLALSDYYKSIHDQQNFYKEMRIAFESPDLDVETKYKILGSFYGLSEKNEDYNKEAYILCAIMLKVHPTSADAHSIYAEFLFKDKKMKEAREEYALASKYDKSRFDTWNRLMYLSSENGDYKNLDLESTEAMELFPAQAFPYFYNGFSNIQLKNYDKAIESLRTGIEFVYDNNPLLLQFYANLGLAYNYINDYDKSDKAFDDALKVDPDDTNILNNYAYFLSLRKKSLEKAERFSRRSNEISPNNAVFMDTYGWILYQQQKYVLAEEWLAAAVKTGGKRAAILEHYGDALYKTGKKDDALNYWKQSKDAGGNSATLQKKISDKTLVD